MAGSYSQDVQDRAREWVNEHYPNVEGAEWEQRFEEACREIAGIDDHNDQAERAGRPPYGPAQRHSAQTKAKDCQGADLAVGDRVSIDKVGEGTVSSVAADGVRIRVPGATPEEESFNAQEIAFWRVQKLFRTVSLARTSGYVYELESGASWQSAPDDAWDTVVTSVDGRVVGRRRIDGSTMVVIEQSGKFYAVLPQNVTMSTSAREGAATRFGRDDDLLDDWIDDWVLLTTGQVGLVQTVRGGQLSVDVAAGPLDHIDDAGWHTVLVPPSMVQRKLNWDEIQKLRTPAGWTSGHTPLLSSATSGARTMARFKRGDHVQIDKGSHAGELGIVVDAFESPGAPGGDSVTVEIADGTRVTLAEKSVSPNSPFTRFGARPPRGAATMARVKARFIDDNTAQFKKGQIVYVDENELKSGGRHVWISEDPDGNRGAYGFASDVELLAATLTADTLSRPTGRTGQSATLNGQSGRVVRRYHADGKDWLLVKTPTGDTLSWPAAEAVVMARSDSAWADLARRHGAASVDETGPTLGAKFTSKEAADAFATDVEAGIGRRPKVGPSPLDPKKWWAELKMFSTAATPMAATPPAVDAYGTALKVGDRVVNTHDGGRGTITGIGTNTDGQPSLQMKWDDGSEHAAAPSWVQKQTTA